MILIWLAETGVWNWILEHLAAVLGIVSTIAAILHKYVQIKEKWIRGEKVSDGTSVRSDGVVDLRRLRADLSDAASFCFWLRTPVICWPPPITKYWKGTPLSECSFHVWGFSFPYNPSISRITVRVQHFLRDDNITGVISCSGNHHLDVCNTLLGKGWSTQVEDSILNREMTAIHLRPFRVTSNADKADKADNTMIVVRGEAIGTTCKGLDNIVMKGETRAYLEGSVHRFLQYANIRDLSESGQARRLGIIIHGDKGTGKSEVARSLTGSDLRVLSPKNLEELGMLLSNFVYCPVGIYVPFQTYFKFQSRGIPSFEKGMQHSDYRCARRLGYKGSQEDFEKSSPPSTITREILKEAPTPLVIIIDDLDRIDFSDTKHIPAVLAAIDQLGGGRLPVILIATTNDYTKIPDVIRRPGRFSVLVKFEVFDAELVDAYVDSMWPDCSDEHRQEFHKLLIGKPPSWAYSMAGKSVGPQVAIDTFEEATNQDWKFEQE